MQLVIDIPGEIRLQILSGVYSGIKDKRVLDAIRAAVALPEGHGQLIDVNDLLDYIGLEDNKYNREENKGEIITLEDIDRIPAIIEADNGEEKCR